MTDIRRPLEELPAASDDYGERHPCIAFVDNSTSRGSKRFHV